MKGLVDRIRVIDDADPAAASAIVEAWEPRLRLDRLSTVPVLYEPDGAIYAVCLEATAEIATDRRVVALSRLDLIVVAPELAVDVVPPSSFLVLRHLGSPPPHFRERFVQVWGFEHRPAAGGPVVLDPEAAGHRLRYEIHDLSAGSARIEVPPHALGFLLAAEDSITIEVGSEDEPADARLLPAGGIALIDSGTSCTLQGVGRAGLVSVVPEALHEASVLERRRRGQPARVDYSPPTGDSNASERSGDESHTETAR